MTQLHQIYKCNICGNMAAMVHGGQGELVCCGEPMKLQKENTVDAAQEKHVPVVEKTDTGYKVTIGSVPHPMTEEHHIEWIELLADGRSYRKMLQPGGEPTAEFCVQGEAVTAREYCNLHGLWKAEA